MMSLECVRSDLAAALSVVALTSACAGQVNVVGSATFPGVSTRLTWSDQQLVLECTDGTTRTLPLSSIQLGGSSVQVSPVLDGPPIQFNIATATYFNGTHVDTARNYYTQSPVRVSVQLFGPSFTRQLSVDGYVSVFNTPGFAPTNCVLTDITGPDVITLTVPVQAVRTRVTVAGQPAVLEMRIGRTRAETRTVNEQSQSVLVIPASLLLRRDIARSELHLNQWDSAWGSACLNPSQTPPNCDTIEAGGCLLTTMTNGLRGELGRSDFTPLDLSNWIGTAGAFDGSDFRSNRPFSVFGQTVQLRDQSGLGVLNALRSNAGSGRYSIVKLPSVQYTPDSPRYHFVLVKGVRDGTNPATASYEDFLVSDPASARPDSPRYLASDDFQDVSLASALEDWGVYSGNSDPVVWFSNTAERDRGGQVRAFEFGGGAGTVDFNPQTQNFLTPPLEASDQNLCVILTDVASGIRHFSREDVAWRWYRESPATRIFTDPFFTRPPGVTDRVQLIRALNDPRYYNFAARRAYFDPARDFTNLVVSAAEQVGWPSGLDTGRPIYGGLSVSIPPSLTDASVRLEVVSNQPFGATFQYNSSGSGVSVSPAVSTFVPASVLGQLIGTFTVNRPAAISFLVKGEDAMYTPLDTGDAEKTLVPRNTVYVP